MLDFEAAQLALRAFARTLSVCTTGSTTLAATASGYTRASGSFLTDGFRVGMEVTPTGFATNPVSTITDVQALAMTVKDARSAEGSASGRTLAVGLPGNRSWENIKFTPEQGEPYVEEQFAPGGMSLDSLGTAGDITQDLLYVLNIYVPQNTGILADGKYATALLSLFKPGTDITAGSTTLFVMPNPGPTRGQRHQEDGFSVIPVKIPLRCYASNS